MGTPNMVAEHLPAVYRRAILAADAGGVIAPAVDVSFSTATLLRRSWLTPVLDRLLSLDRLERLYRDSRATPGSAGVLDRALELLDIRYEIETGSLDAIPRSGPLLLTANHPFGILEGLLLCTLLRRVRSDVRILTNSVLSSIPELREVCIFADTSGDRISVPANSTALKRCLEWLDQGGALVAFPAGEVSQFQWASGCVADSPWNPAVARLAERVGATTVPLYFRGANSAAFQLAGLIHPLLRTLSLPRELFKQRGRRIAIRIGRPVSPATLRACGKAAIAIQHLRRRTDLLARDTVPKPRATVLQEPIADAIDPELLAADVAGLPSDRKLCENGALSVWIGSAAELPHILREIGRLREIAFRGAGEGTGHSRDLDRFDPHYRHLFIWNAAEREVAGAYRLAATPDILPRLGPAGLYTSTLFRFHPRWFERVGPAIELGRSFVRPEYQKQYAPLLLLWKGIGRYAASRPECSRLFGAVSISEAYCAQSRDLMVRMLEGHLREDLSALVSPRNPYPAPRIQAPAEVEQVSKLVSDLEPDRKGVPILIKQYLKSGGKVIAFNLDRAFSNALDALVLVDLREASPNLQARLHRTNSIAFSSPPVAAAG
jgi:putative hemolysin